jgi:hypothetical protein
MGLQSNRHAADFATGGKVGCCIRAESAAVW